MKKNVFRTEEGYSFIEMLVAIAIFALVSAGVYATFNSGQTEYGVRQLTIRMQQQARLAMTNLERDLKMIGYGFVDLGNLKVNVYQGAPISWDIIAATDNTVVPSINNMVNTDTLTFRYFNGPLDLSTDVTITIDHPESSANTPVSSAAGFNNQDLFIIYDPNDPIKPASMLQVTGTSNVGGDSIIHNSGNSDFNPPGGAINEIFPQSPPYSSTGYGPGCKVLNIGQNMFYRVRYYIDNNLNLVKETQGDPTQTPVSRIVANGVEDLQITYQFKDDGNWYDSPVTDGTDPAHDVGNLRALRVSIIVRTQSADRNFNSIAAYQLTGDSGNGVAYAGGGFRRIIMSTTISLRNMAMRG